MAIKRYNGTTKKWEYVGNPGTVSPTTIGAVSTAGGSTIVPATISTKGISVQATSGQTANLQEWQNSSGVAQASVDANGNLNAYNYNMAGKNFIINGAQEIAQRGTSFSSPASAYTIDRFKCTHSGNTGTLSQVSSIGLSNFQYAARIQRTSGNTGTAVNYYGYASETNDVIPMQGKTMTLSFWARSGANYSSASNILNFNLASGNGTTGGIQVFSGLTNEINHVSGIANLTASWQRFSATFTMRSDATEMRVYWFNNPTGTAGAADYFDITGIQLEIGSTATPFSRYAGTYPAELAACQRYYYRTSQNAAYTNFTGATAASSSTAAYNLPIWLPVQMRVAPTALDFSSLRVTDGYVAANNVSNVIISGNSATIVNLDITSSSLTIGRPVTLQSNGTSGYLGFSAEL
jgi:hypothetical protein